MAGEGGVWHPIATVTTMSVGPGRTPHPAGASRPHGRWSPEHVRAVAPSPAALALAERLATGGRWADGGCDDRSVWGRCSGTSSEPYDCAVDHVVGRYRCTCASRQRPCKHALALLLRWAAQQVPLVLPDTGGARSTRPTWLAAWLAESVPGATSDPTTARRRDTDRGTAGTTSGDVPLVEAADDTAAEPVPSPPVDGAEGGDRSARDDRVATTAAGLRDFDRWLHDRVRTGLGGGIGARRDEWEAAAARLVDAKAGALAARARRLALSAPGSVDGAATSPTDEVGRVLAEVSMLHTLCAAGQRLGDLPPDLGDSVALSIGWQVRQADVLAGVPHTDSWVVMGRADQRDERIVTRRTWLRGAQHQQWAMVLSFAAFGQALADDLWVGRVLEADLFRYPGALGLRAVVGRVHDVDRRGATWLDAIAAADVAAACAEVGAMVAAEPWSERLPVCMVAAPRRLGRSWVLADDHGAVPMSLRGDALAGLLACTAYGAVPLTCEWTPEGFVPIAVFLPDRVVDIGAVADRGSMPVAPDRRDGAS